MNIELFMKYFIKKNLVFNYYLFCGKVNKKKIKFKLMINK